MGCMSISSSYGAAISARSGPKIPRLGSTSPAWKPCPGCEREQSGGRNRVWRKNQLITTWLVYERDRSQESGRSELGHGMNVDFVRHGFFDLRDIG
jgi:hypothetical protein